MPQALMPPDRPDDALRQLDWDAQLVCARRVVRARLSGFNSQDIEDAAQDVMLRVILFVRRRGQPDSVEALLVVIARRVCASVIQRRQKERSRTSHSEGEERRDDRFDDAPEQERDEDVWEECQRVAFIIREYLKLRRASCVPIADALARAETLKEHAARNILSYDQVRKTWSRCVAFIHEAVRKGRLRLGWEPPDSQERADD